MQIEKQLVLDELGKAGRNEHVERAIRELPGKGRPRPARGTATEAGLDPPKLAAKAAERALGEL